MNIWINGAVSYVWSSPAVLKKGTFILQASTPRCETSGPTCGTQGSECVMSANGNIGGDLWASREAIVGAGFSGYYKYWYDCVYTLLIDEEDEENKKEDHECQLHDVARGKVRGPLKSVRMLLWGTWLSEENQMASHLAVLETFEFEPMERTDRPTLSSSLEPQAWRETIILTTANIWHVKHICSQITHKRDWGKCQTTGWDKFICQVWSTSLKPIRDILRTSRVHEVNHWRRKAGLCRFIFLGLQSVVCDTQLHFKTVRYHIYDFYYVINS